MHVRACAFVRACARERASAARIQTLASNANRCQCDGDKKKEKWGKGRKEIGKEKEARKEKINSVRTSPNEEVVFRA